MKTILVPIDFSNATRGVIDTAFSLATAPGAQIHLLHSLQPPMVTTDYGLGMEGLQETVMVAQRNAERQLSHLQDELAGRGVTVTTSLTHGPAAPTIAEKARELTPDAIVLGSHGHTALYDLLVGSTTNAVLKHATCPVVIVPPSKAR